MADRAACQTLDDGRAGILLNEATPEAIVKAVIEIENRQIETEGRTCHGLRLAGDRYALAASAKRLAEILEECCKVSRFAGNGFGAPAS